MRLFSLSAVPGNGGQRQDPRRRATRLIVLGLGAAAMALCWGRITTLAELIQFTGAFVASTIWPIVAGLYWKTTNRLAAGLASGATESYGDAR